MNKVWELARPYRVRLFLGVAAGVLAGLIEPLMILTVAFVFGAIFPPANGSGIEAKLQKLPGWLPEGLRHGVQDTIRDALARLHAAMAGGAQAHFTTVLLLVGLIPAVFLLRGLFTYLNIYLLQWTAVRAVRDLRTRLFSHLLGLSTGFFARNPSGELMSRIVNDTTMLQLAISNATSVIVVDPVKLVSILALLLWAQPQLTLVSLLVLPATIIPIVIFGRKARRSARAMQEHMSEISQVMAEGFTGNRVVKAYNLEKIVGDQFFAAASRHAAQFLRLVRANQLLRTLVEFFGAVGITLVFLYMVWNPRISRSSDDFVMFIGALFSIYRPLKNLTGLHNELAAGQAASARVFELLTTKNSVPEPVQPKLLQGADAEIYFDHIEFAYGEKAVLRGIDLRIQPGQLVALVGASGSGKTTLSNLLLRFDDPQRGAVRIGGTDIREFSTRDLRNQIAVVAQETVLFNETIRRNIELGRPGAGEEEIISAAKHAYAHEFIMTKPQGYDTVIGEKGVTLSGGQRQRLAIARAVLRNAPILILDEATSALDTESERAVQTALDELMQGRTTLCIAHRLSTIHHADLIVVLDQGRIVETGKHAELIQRGGVYQKLYEMQFRS